MGRGLDAEALACAALEWLVNTSGAEESGAVRWPEAVPSSGSSSLLYGGGAGIVLALLEADSHFGDSRYADLAMRATAAVMADVTEVDDCSLYFGLTGLAVALRAAEARLGNPAAGKAARRALQLVWDRHDGQRWSEFLEVIGGNAGIALGALSAGDLDLALLAVSPFSNLAEETPNGITWQHRLGSVPRLHHISHGTLGMAYALAATGAAAGRQDLVDLAVAGMSDVIARNVDGEDGFLVPHSDPPHKPEIVPRYSYGWCHGPAGDAQAFRLMVLVTGDQYWQTLADRCWKTVTASGLPRRSSPGFWDNSGRCCGTAGVLALACDRLAEGREAADFAEALVEDLAATATLDSAGARWSNIEHRVTPSELAPRTGWAMGNAGIVRELLRYARITSGRDPGYAVQWPDQPAVGSNSADPRLATP